ncbi:MAG TPA: hypothetical protein PLP29_08110 [Candidatus Ozemobacteraceae bacterium]|nr:hypothetical protein [Candidatus Ozemobacteraceae bacterium]
MSVGTLLRCAAAAVFSLGMAGSLAAADLQATILTTQGKTIEVTAITPEGRIEYTPEGGKKTVILFRDIKRIDWDKETRIHTVTTSDGKTQKLERAWIFAGNSAYLSFTGTDKETKEDANGTITGSDIASIEFTDAVAAPATPAPADSAQAPEPAAKPAEPAAPATPAEPAAPAPELAKPVKTAKRLSTNNIDYTKDAVAEFEQKMPAIAAAYEKARAAGSLTAEEKDPRTDEMELKEILLLRDLHNLFHGIVKNYVAALGDGWEASDAELAPYHDNLAALLPQLEKLGYRSSFHPDDPACENLENMDRALIEARKAMLLTTARGNANAGQKLMENVEATLEQVTKVFADANQADHPALARFKTEVDRVKKACEAGFADAGKAKETAMAAWEALRAERERLQETTYKIENGQLHPDAWAGFIEELEKFEKTETAVVKQKIETLGKICGANADTLESAMETLLGKNPSGWDWSAEVKHFDKIFKAIPAFRKSIGEGIAEQAQQNLAMMSAFAEAIRAKKFDELKELVKLGLRYDPHNAALIDLTTKVEEAAAGDAAAIEKQIAERQWPGNHKGFAGPGSPDELNKAALEYFNSTCKPTEKALTACIVEPEWYCFKRNIFGQPVQWALTFWVAVDVEGETTPDVVYAWSISFLTEENVDVVKAPPFKWAAFNFKQKMKRANVPGLK